MVALFVMGVVCILIEIIFFPGVFFLAVGGVLMVLAALFFSMVDLYPAQPVDFSFDRLQVPMWNIMIAFAASAVGMVLLAKFLPRIPVFRGLFLSSTSPSGASLAPVVSELGDEARLNTGDAGVALSILRPSGRARIGDGVFDVMTNGEFIDAATEIQVLAVSGRNIIVGRRGT